MLRSRGNLIRHDG